MCLLLLTILSDGIIDKKSKKKCKELLDFSPYNNRRNTLALRECCC